MTSTESGWVICTQEVVSNSYLKLSWNREVPQIFMALNLYETDNRGALDSHSSEEENKVEKAVCATNQSDFAVVRQKTESVYTVRNLHRLRCEGSHCDHNLILLYPLSEMTDPFVRQVWTICGSPSVCCGGIRGWINFVGRGKSG